MALTIDNLEIQIEAEATKATSGIDSLAASLTKLKEVVGGSSGLPANLKSIADSIRAFNVKNNLKSVANGIKALNEATASLDGARLAEFSRQMQGLASGLSNLSGIGKSNIGSIVNAIKKIPDITKSLDPATIDAFSSAVQKLTEVVTPLGIQMDAIARGFNSLPGPIKRAVNAMNKAESTGKKATTTFRGFGNSLAHTAARFWTLYYSMQRIADVFSDAFKESNEYIESLNLFRVSMGDASDAAMEYAEAVRDAMGIDVAEWITNQGNFMRMSTGFGIATDQAEVMSRNLTQLAYDMSSFFNVDVQTAMDKLQSGMSGQIKGLKEWGYNLSVAALQETALSLGIEQSVRTMTEAQKAQLRYITLIQKSQGVMGDMAKTINTPANSMRILGAMIERLQRAFGNIVSVLVTKYIPYVMAFVEIMEEAASALAEAWGFEIPELPENNLEMGADVIEGIGDNAEDTADQIAELKKQLMVFDELNILKDNSNANKNASYDLGFDMPDYDFMSGLEAIDLEPYKQKMKEILDLAVAIGIAIASWKIGTGLINGMDDFVRLLSNANKLSSQLKIAGGLTALLGGFALEADGIVGTIKEALTGINFAEIVGGGIVGTGGAALLGSTLATWISKAFAGSAVDLALTQAGINLGVGTIGAAGAAIGSGVASIIAGIPMYFTGIYDAIKNALTWLNSLLVGFGATLAGTGIGAIIGACGGPIGAGIGALIGLAVGLVTDGILAIIDICKNGANTLNTVLALMLVAGVGSMVPIIGPLITIGSYIGIAITLIKEFSDEISALWQKFTETPVGAWIDKHIVQPVAKAFSSIAQFASDCWDSITEFFAPAVSWFSELFGSIEQTASDIFYNIGVIGSGCWTVIQIAWSEGLTWINETIIQPLSDLFSELWNGFVEGAKKAWEACKAVFSPVVEFFGEIFSAAWAKVVEVLSPLGVVFVKIKDAILAGFKVVVNGLIKGLNSVIAIPFNGLNDALSFLKNATIFDIKPFEGLKSINVPEIPLLANGGFPSMGQMFIARERGPELVGRIGNKNAVANNDQIITGIASAVYSAMMAAQEDGNNGNGGSARIVVQIGDQAVGEASVRYINGQIVQTGASPIYA